MSEINEPRFSCKVNNGITFEIHVDKIVIGSEVFPFEEIILFACRRLADRKERLLIMNRNYHGRFILPDDRGWKPKGLLTSIELYMKLWKETKKQKEMRK